LTLELLIQRLPHAEGLAMPRYETAGAAGFDLVAAIPINSPLKLEIFSRQLVPTGLRLQIPEGYEAQVRPRSGLALKFGITVLNAPGTIDHDYRGELMVLLVNLGGEPFVVERGMRIAQMVIAPVTRVAFREVDSLDETSRADGGFGSTGI
jgi:dUTP pyrophosphatase